MGGDPVTAIEHPSYAEFIENGGEPIRPGFYKLRREGVQGWVEVQIKPDPTGKFDFAAVDGRGHACNAELVWTRCKESTAEAFRATIQRKVTYPMEATALPMQSDSIAAISAALAEAQAELTNVPRNREVEVKKDSKALYTFTYATLDSILDLIRPVLSAKGLAFTQTLLPAGKLMVVTTLAHSSGEWFRSYLPIETSGTSQVLGSAISYAKRYAITAMLGITAEDDDDANAADGNTVKKLEPVAPKAPPKPPAKPAAPAETPEQKTARWWAGDDLQIPKLRLSWQEWQAKVLKAIEGAPSKAHVDRLMADNAYSLNALQAEVPAAHAVISAAVKGVK